MKSDYRQTARKKQTGRHRQTDRDRETDSMRDKRKHSVIERHPDIATDLESSDRQT